MFVTLPEMNKITVLLLMLVLSACASQAKVDQAVLETVQSIPTQTPYPTLAALPTLTSLPTYTPQPTYTPPPTYTPYPSPTLIPTETATPTLAATPDPWKMTFEELQEINHPVIADHQPGFYLVMVDIAPGYWRSQSQGQTKCYWSITDKAGNIINNHFGLSGGAMFVPLPSNKGLSDPYQVEMGEYCGTWKWLYLTPP